MKSLWSKMLMVAGVGLAANAQAAESGTVPVEPPVPPPIVAILENATRDLQMPSETDAPFRAFFLPLENKKLPDLPPEKIAGLLKLKHPEHKETRELKDFFESPATVEDWMEDEEKATALRFAALRDLLEKELKFPCVLVFGETEMEVVIIGETDGGVAGVVTLIIET